jgi:hypothetical protein
MLFWRKIILMRLPSSLLRPLLAAAVLCLLGAAAPALAGDNDWRPIDPTDLALKEPKVEKDDDAEAIFREVRINDDASGLTPEQRAKAKANKSPADTLKRGQGTSEDIDMLFAALATAAGFDAHVGELGDRGDIFFDPSYANAYFMNRHVVAVKEGEGWRFFFSLRKEHVGSNAPNSQSYKLPSSKQIKVNNVGRMSFPNGDSALVMNYETEISIDNKEALRKEIDEIWSVFQTDIEKAEVKAGVIRATHYEGSIVRQGKGYGFVFVKGDDRKWQLQGDEKR